MTGHFKAGDLAAVREEGSLAALFAHLTGKPIPEPEAAVEEEPLGYHIPRKGAWPCGTAPSGPTPPPCDDCHATTPPVDPRPAVNDPTTGETP